MEAKPADRRIQYRRLPGVAVGIFERRRLWLGPDHILSVRTLVTAQEYRRFYLHEIQTIVLARTGNSWAYYVFSSSVFLALLFALLFYAWHPIWAAICGVVSLVLLLTGLRLPNCACYLKTATTTERLPSLGRARAANKTLAILRAAIEATQGCLEPEP